MSMILLKNRPNHQIEPLFFDLWDKRGILLLLQLTLPLKNPRPVLR